jgi:cytochrome c-type biogenesis protein CcmE
MTAHARRLARGALLVGALAVAVALVLFALRDNLVFFYTPSELARRTAPPGSHIRIGGVVEGGSLRRERGSLTVHFFVADDAHRVPVVYSGLLPDLFRETKGVVAAGRFVADGSFVATEVLAKHDENYQAPRGSDGGVAATRPAWVRP